MLQNAGRWISIDCSEDFFTYLPCTVRRTRSAPSSAILITFRATDSDRMRLEKLERINRCRAKSTARNTVHQGSVSRTCATDASTSFVTVVAIVCFATGCADPIGTFPTVIVLKIVWKLDIVQMAELTMRRMWRLAVRSSMALEGISIKELDNER